MSDNALQNAAAPAATRIAAIDIPTLIMALVLVLLVLAAALVYALTERSAPDWPGPGSGADPVLVSIAAGGKPVALPAAPSGAEEALTPRMRAALDYTARRYRVSATALQPVFAAAKAAAGDLGLDPLLIIAVIGVESSFNPLSESTQGAQGLMQVIPRFHRDKLPASADSMHLFDPVANVRVGARALWEYIRDSGDLAYGLQKFAGNRDDATQSYAEKVLAEKERLESAACRQTTSAACVGADGTTRTTLSLL